MRPLERLAGLLGRRARIVVGVWFLLFVVLAGQGRGVEDDLAVSVFFVDGTQSKRAHELSEREFGNEIGLTAMLRGPAPQAERQARLLAQRLEEGRRFLVLTPWNGGVDVGSLHPRPGVVGLLIRETGVATETTTDMLAQIEGQIEATVEPPVRSSVAGIPAFLDSMRDTSEHATGTGELIAIPVLLIVLLFVFRSVLAALMPLVVGGAVVASARGLLSFVAGPVEIDLFALGVVGMLGLALGVDYSLLTVSRFREELRKGLDQQAAIAVTVAATTRAVVPAACGLLIAMGAALLVYPSVTTQSIAVSVGLVTVLSALSALLVVPSMLVVAGDNLDRWALPERRNSEIVPLRLSRRLTSHPGAIVAILVVLLSFSAMAFGLNSGVASVDFLPRDDRARIQQEEIEGEIGPGWVSPMEVVVNGRGSPLTSSERLRAVSAFERRLKEDPGIETVAGLGAVKRQLQPLEGMEKRLVEQQRGLDRLGGGIARLHEGALLTTGQFAQAAEGARAIHFGVGDTHEGAERLAQGLAGAGAGSARLSEGLLRASDGSGGLAKGSAQASKGADRLNDGLEQAQEGSAELAESTHLLENALRSGEQRLVEVEAPLKASGEQLAAALSALQRMTVGRDDPEYAAALQAVEGATRSLTGTDPQTGERADPAYGGVLEGVERADGQFEVGLYLTEKVDKGGREAEQGIERLAKGSARLDRSLDRLRASSLRLSEGIDELSRGGEALSPELVRIGEGTERLAEGLEQLEGGSGTLADGLGGGSAQTSRLSDGLRRIQVSLERQQPQGGAFGIETLRSQSPLIFRAGYFNLAALAGSTPERRLQLGSLLNLDKDGSVARLVVVPRDPPASADAVETKHRVEGQTAAFARSSGSEVVLGGVAPGLADANEKLRDEAIWLRLVLSLISFLVLVPVTRSLTIPAMAAVLNLITVSACFGALSLLFDGSLLGGPGFVDATVLHASMIVMFGLAIDYEVFVFSRMREEYVRTGSPSAALQNGLDRTAHVITGAAVIMITVFLAFSVSELITLRNFGVAQALGVFIDAFLIRLVVIPAVMARLGRWSWWMPAWLDRLLPGGRPVGGGERLAV